MPEFGWKLQPPEELAATQSWEEFVSESVDWEDNYASQVILACDYLELCGYTFAVHGFGREVWPVTVGYDLSTILEDMPSQLSALENDQPVKIDMYAPGTEVEIDAVPSGDDVVLKCTTAMWEPEPDTIVASRVDFARTIQEMLADFSAALGNVDSSLADVEPFLGWSGPAMKGRDSVSGQVTQSDESLAVELAENFPSLGENIDVYYDDPETFLAHVYFGVEVTQKIVAAYVADVSGDSAGHQLDWRAVLNFLNDKLLTGDQAVRTVIGTSVLFQLPNPGQAGYAIVNELDDELAHLFKLARPNG